jgi:hypothetical protein
MEWAGLWTGGRTRCNSQETRQVHAKIEKLLKRLAATLARQSRQIYHANLLQKYKFAG